MRQETRQLSALTNGHIHKHSVRHLHDVRNHFCHSHKLWIQPEKNLRRKRHLSILHFRCSCEIKKKKKKKVNETGTGMNGWSQKWTLLLSRNRSVSLKRSISSWVFSALALNVSIISICVHAILTALTSKSQTTSYAGPSHVISPRFQINQIIREREKKKSF